MAATPTLRQMLPSAEGSPVAAVTPAEAVVLTPPPPPAREAPGGGSEGAGTVVIGLTAGSTEASSSGRQKSGGYSMCVLDGQQQSTEIRTKVFRMGAPLLRSTIPVVLGSSTHSARREVDDENGAARRKRKEGLGEDIDDDGDDFDGSDAETILSMSEVGVEDLGALSVTFDFPV